MRASSVSSEALDIRTRLLLSLAVSGVSIYLSGTGPLLALGAATLLYVLTSGRYRVILVSYLAVCAMMAFTVGVIVLSFKVGEALVAGTSWERGVWATSTPPSCAWSPRSTSSSPSAWTFRCSASWGR